MEQYQTYRAYYLEGEWTSVITSVLAPSPEAAQARVEVELSKPGRYRYWQRWVRDGRLVQRKEGESGAAES